MTRISATQRVRKGRQVLAYGRSSHDREIVPPSLFHMTDDARIVALADAVGVNARHAGTGRLALTAVLQRIPLQLRSATKVSRALRHAIEHANTVVMAAEPTTSVSSMADALAVAALVFCDSGLVIANVGNCRCYCFTGKRLRLLAREHSAVTELRASAGRATPAMDVFALHHRHVLTRALGLGPGVVPDVVVHDLHHGGRYLLCTAGFWERIFEPELETILAGTRSLEEASRACTIKVAERGSVREYSYPYAFVLAEYHGRSHVAA